ncbi:hypothetical protein EV182_007802, partial [Spiromyces aspiralis]
ARSDTSGSRRGADGAEERPALPPADQTVDPPALRRAPAAASDALGLALPALSQPLLLPPPTLAGSRVEPPSCVTPACLTLAAPSPQPQPQPQSTGRRAAACFADHLF